MNERGCGLMKKLFLTAIDQHPPLQVPMTIKVSETEEVAAFVAVTVTEVVVEQDDTQDAT